MLEMCDSKGIIYKYRPKSMNPMKDLNEEYIIPNAFDERIVKIVAEAVSKAAIQSGVALLN